MGNIVGTWRLISFEIRRNDVPVAHPFGKDAIGYGVFTEEGYMMVSLMPAKRTKFTSNDVMGGTIEEKASATETYISYSGRYEMHDNNFTTYVKMSLFPNWVGTKQERFFEVKGDLLTAYSPPILIQGAEQTAHTIWERVKKS
jgi:hypothetical protein